MNDPYQQMVPLSSSYPPIPVSPPQPSALLLPNWPALEAFMKILPGIVSNIHLKKMKFKRWSEIPKQSEKDSMKV